MSAWGAIRRTGAVCFVPGAFTASILLALSGLVERTHYFVADLAAAALSSVYIVGPVTATVVAFRAAGFTRALATMRPARAVLRVVLREWWPLLAGAPAAFALGLLFALRYISGDPVGWAMLAVYAATVAAAGGLGFVLGQVLPSVAAVPVAFVATYVWTAFPAATGDLTLHQLDGTFTGCCSSDTVPTWFTVVASGVLLLVVLVGFATVAHLAGRGWFGLAAAAVPTVLVLAFGAGAAVAHTSPEELSLMPVTDRTTPQVCRQNAEAKVCVWPESRSRVGLALEEATKLRTAVRQAGLPPPDLFAEGWDTLSSSPFGLASYVSDAAVRESLASGYAWHLEACISGDPEASPSLAAGMAIQLLSGTDRSELADSSDSARSVERAEAAVRSGTVAELFGPAEAWSRSECADR